MSDYNFLMESRLSSAQFQLLNELSRIAHAEGINLYLVGGVVRDMTYGQAVIRDLDFAVEGDFQKILRRLRMPGSQGKASAKPAHRWEQAPAEVSMSRVDKRLMCVELWFSNGVHAEIAQCRQEAFSKPGRPPEVSPAMIFDDLKRRDFALNAMAVSLHPNSRGLLLDPKNGVADIERQEIRALHSRTFVEDPSRIYRLFRLGVRLGFKPEEKTQRWLDSALQERAWLNMSPEGQRRELEAVLREENSERVLKIYEARGILAGLDRNLTRLRYDQFSKIRVISRKLPGADLFLLHFHCLVSKLSGPQKVRLAKKILVDSSTIKLALNLEKEAKKVARLLASSKYAVPSQAFKLLSTQPEPLLPFLLAYFPQVKVQNRLKNYLFKAPQIRARLPRHELQALGVKPGAKFESILEQVFFKQLDGKIKTPQQLSKTLRLIAGIKEPEAPPPSPPEKKSAKPAGAKEKQAHGKDSHAAFPEKTGAKAMQPQVEVKKRVPAPPPEKKSAKPSESQEKQTGAKDHKVAAAQKKLSESSQRGRKQSSIKIGRTPVKKKAKGK